MNDAVVQALLAIALAVVSGVLSILGLWAKAKWGTEKLNQWAEQASTIVRSAEQIGALYGWDGDKKKEYALALMIQAGVKPDMAEAFVEAAVHSLIKYGSEMVNVDGSVVNRECEAE